ncbi:MAG: agmatine deiminase family protein [Bacteroidales bacterium]|nr:agmatine deiminase family protein [Bacteroidales bacterium]
MHLSKKFFLTLTATALAFAATAQNAITRDDMLREWRQTKQKRDISLQAQYSNIPLGEAAATPKSEKALPDDRVWFPGEWEEVKAIVVTPYYSYDPDTNLGSGYFMADPMVTGIAEYYKYNYSRGWESLNQYGPYRSTMDTTTTFGQVFFRLMDGIQLGHAQAWVRVEKEEDTATVLRTLRRMNLRHDNVRFIVGAGNSFWYRDCGPICFYHGDQDSVAMMDFEYYPGRALDDSLPSLIYRQMGIPNYINSIEWEGGNCLVDGAGFLLSSDAIYSNNSDTYGQVTWDGQNVNSIHYTTKPRLTNAQTRQALASLLGQRETHILPAYQYDGGTGHIDLYADMCEENGFVFSVMPNDYRNWTDYRTGSRNIDSLCSYTSIFDRPYYKTTIPFPSKDNGSNFNSQLEYNDSYTRTYSNHTFVNDVILQPCFSAVANGVPTALWDRNNIELLKAAYPGYTIYPVDVRDFDGSGGAIHCVTKQIPADNPVRILHKSIVGSAVDMRGSDIPVSAIITNRSGIAQAICAYRYKYSWANGARYDYSEWDSIAMTANGNKYSCLLPTASINERIMDTTYTPGSYVDSTLVSTDTSYTLDSTFAYFDTVSLDSVYTYDTTYSYVFHYNYDTINYIDTVTSLHDTLITVEYFISATSNNGKTITKPMTANHGGYYSFYFDGTLKQLDSMQYDFTTEPRPATDITFVFDANRTTRDTSTTPVVAIAETADDKGFGQFYPNPATEQAKIQIDLGNGGIWNVDIIDQAGRIVHTTQLQTAGSIVFAIRTDSLPAGIYTVRFASGGKSIARRLVVK